MHTTHAHSQSAPLLLDERKDDAAQRRLCSARWGGGPSLYYTKRMS